MGAFFRTDSFEHLESVHPRHLQVKKHEVRKRHYAVVKNAAGLDPVSRNENLAVDFRSGDRTLEAKISSISLSSTSKTFGRLIPHCQMVQRRFASDISDFIFYKSI